jgi:hypothetical protein
LTPILLNDNDIFDAYPTDGAAIESRFNRDNITDEQLRTTHCEQGWFMNF